MALLESSKIKLGSLMPAFSLPDANKEMHSSDQLMGQKGLLIAFTCNHCPYAIAVWDRFIQLANKSQELGINTTAINPNIHPSYPQDAPDQMLVKIKEWNITFPYLVDESQQVSKDYDAQCTPDIYLLNAKHELVYHGRIDDNWEDESKVTQQELLGAIQALGNDQKISSDQKFTIGCSIKWK